MGTLRSTELFVQVGRVLAGRPDIGDHGMFAGVHSGLGEGFEQVGQRLPTGRIAQFQVSGHRADVVIDRRASQ